MMLRTVFFYNSDPQDYIHRVGRTARGAFSQGKALLCILPNEKKIIEYIKNSGIINLKEYEFEENKLLDIQNKFEKIISSNMSLEDLAKDAYKSYIFVILFKFSPIYIVNLIVSLI